MPQWTFTSFGTRYIVSLDSAVGQGAVETEVGQSRATRELLDDVLELCDSHFNQETLLDLHRSLTGKRLSRFDTATPASMEDRWQIERALDRALSQKRIRVEKLDPAVTLVEETEIAPEMRPQDRVEEVLSTFEFILVDEVGDAIAGIDVKFTAQSKSATAKTDAQGIARFKDFEGSIGTATLKDPTQIEQAMESKWAEGRIPAKLPAEFLKLRYQEKLGDFRLEGDVPLRVSVRPELGRLDVELKDKLGRVAHANEAVKVKGPVSFDSTTDDGGRVLYDEVPAGDYELTLTQTFNEKLKLDSVDYKTAVVVLGSFTNGRQERHLGAVPQCKMVRMRGMLFDTNKCFLLPTSLDALSKIREVYEEHDPCKLLIVGHTDTSGEPSVNDPLSVARAEAVKQYLEDDADAWLKNYDSGKPEKQRWGSREDRLMWLMLPGYAERKEQKIEVENGEPREPTDIEWYQLDYNARVDAGQVEGPALTADGKIGPKTRKALIVDYMAMDGVKLADIKDFTVEITTHGCGENYPLDKTTFALDQRAVAERDGEEDRHDRRVELFFFEPEYGIVPAPSDAKGDEYLTWRELSRADTDEVVEGIKNKATVLPVKHAHFRTGSAVMLPEGGPPDKDGKVALTSVGALATALRYNEEHPAHTMMIAGHTDSVGGDENQKLSEQRAQMVHAVLTGDRDTFVKIADETGTDDDWKQILKWSSQAFLEVPKLVSADAEEAEDEAPTTNPQGFASFAGAADSVEHFQKAYNTHRENLGGPEELVTDGDVGKKTWGAIFDLYQYNMAQELGEDMEGVKELRKLVKFVETDEEWIGFGEAHPADGNNKDAVASEANRRVEVLFFGEGQEPDLALLKEAPEMTELYAKDAFGKVEIESRSWGARQSFDLQIWLVDEFGHRLPNVEYELTIGNEKRVGVTTSDGLFEEKTVPTVPVCQVSWRKAEQDEYDFSQEVRLKHPKDEEKRVDAQLKNLGYSDGDPSARLEAFALDEELGGAPRSERIVRLDAVHSGDHGPDLNEEA